MKEYFLCLRVNQQSLEEKLQFKSIPIPENIKEIVNEVEYWDMDYQWTEISNGEIFIKNTPDYNEHWYSTIQFIPYEENGILHRTAKGSTLHHSFYDNYPTSYIPFAYDGERLLVMLEYEWDEKYAKEKFPNINVPLVLLTPVGKDNFLKRIEIKPHPEASSEAAVVHNIPPRDIVKQIGLRPLPVDEKLFSFEDYDQPNKTHKNIIYSTPNIRDTLYKVRYWRSGGPRGYTKWENGRVVIDEENILLFDWLGETYYEFDATKTYVKCYNVYPYGNRYDEYKRALDSFTVSAYDGKQIILSSNETNGAYIICSIIPASQEEIEIIHLHANRKPPILKWHKRLIFGQIPHPVCRPLTTEPIGKVRTEQATIQRAEQR